MKRDAQADLAVCNAATPGLWEMFNVDDSMFMNMYGVKHRNDLEPSDEYDLNSVICVTLLQTGAKIGGETQDGKEQPEGPWRRNADLIALSRTALPHWIERAEKAERFVEMYDGAFRNACSRCKAKDGGCQQPMNCMWYRLWLKAREVLGAGPNVNSHGVPSAPDPGGI